MPTRSGATLIAEPLVAPTSPGHGPSSIGRPTCPPESDERDGTDVVERVATDSPPAVTPAPPTPAPLSPTTSATTTAAGQNVIAAMDSMTVDGESPKATAAKPEDAVFRGSPSPLSAAEESSECDNHVPHSNTSVAAEPSVAPYMFQSPFPPARSRFRPNTCSSLLRPGSKFHGEQKSDSARYGVQVEIQHVDIAESFVCGYLSIQGLANAEQTLTTYFEGEIIGNKYTFLTKHPDWGANEKVDLSHWARFPAWRPLSKQAKRPDFSFKNFAQRENIFMRWKEYFLVPDHNRKTVNGASYEGFYYICFNQVTGTISGMYYHARTAKFQKLELKHVNDHGCLGAMEFR